MSDLVHDDVLDDEQIELLLGLDDGEGAILAEIAEEFCTLCSTTVTQLRDGLGASDLEVVRQGAHSLKGACANVGAGGCARLCAGIEAAATAGDLINLKAQIELLHVELDRARQALRGVTTRG